MPDEQRITLNPEEPVQGQKVKICYNFDGSGITSTTLTVTFGPDGAGTDYVVSSDDPCVTVSVPEDATSITVEDGAGTSPDKWAPVSPS